MPRCSTPFSSRSRWPTLEPRTLTPALASQTRWQLLGPGNFSGRVNAIAVDPGDTQRIFVCTSSGGVWRTVDGGQTWVDIGASLGCKFTGAVAVQPTNGNVVYVGTGTRTPVYRERACTSPSTAAAASP